MGKETYSVREIILSPLKYGVSIISMLVKQILLFHPHLLLGEKFEKIIRTVITTIVNSKYTAQLCLHLLKGKTTLKTKN